MALKHMVGIDHVVVAVRDLALAAQAWKAAGFTVSPRGKHSDYMGTANHTIVFEHDYIELMGIDQATAHNQPTIDFLKEREGIERVAFTTDDAAALAAELKAHGLAAAEPVSFSRPVPLPDGGSAEARFQIATWPHGEAPAGLRVFACQHYTRDAVWILQLQQHANGARRLMRIELVAQDPEASAAHMGRLIDQPVRPVTDGWAVASGADRAQFVFYTAAAWARRYPDAVRAGAVASGAATIVLATDDLAKARAIGGAVAHGDAVSIPAAKTTGVIVSFIVG